jgi:serine/threonine protein kinase
MDPAPEKTVFVPRSSVKSDLFQAGDIVGQYSVKKVLGAGGMGVVYLVEHTALKKNFALKALPAVLAQEKSFVERFKREATMLARLKHAHIVNVTDFGESQGKLYLVLEYVDGGSFEEWFEKNRKAGSGAPPADVQRLIEQVLEGLAHAHQAGIVHRDLKPANVLLEKTGEAKISDFGLARAVADEEYRRTGGTASPFQGDSVTTTGTMVGTIDFMSPEARNMRPSDLRSDIYALGVITYYLLTGRKPSGIAKPATQLVPGLDPRWDKFIGTCLAEDPAHRYQTSMAALEALRQIRQSGGAKRWLVPAVLAALALAGVGIWLWPRPVAPVATAPLTKPALTTAGSQSPTDNAKTQSEPAKLLPEAPVNRKFVLFGLPAEAVVTYHGRNHPVGPAGRVRLELPPGPQSVRVKAPGYLDWEGEIGADEKETEATLPLEQVPPHPVRFTGLPAQAQLKIGERTVTADTSGTALVELRPGNVTLAVSAPKYQNLELAVDILQATESYQLEMKKLPPPPGVLVKLPGSADLKFKWVPPGDFFLGSPPDERGRQRTDLPRTKTDIPKGFYMAETEMTQRQHRAITGKNPSDSRALGDETRPVEQVAWRDLAGPGGVLEKMNDVLRRLGLPYKADLPTEVEWEYACRAGTESAFNDGSQLTNERDDPALDALAFYSRGGAQNAPSPVARFKPNSWGLYDMLGNVGEWTYGVRGTRDPVIRGGNWKVGPVHCRSASRVELTPETRPTDTMGYRLVLRPTEE